LYKSCRILAAYQALLDFIHEQFLLQPMTALCCACAAQPLWRHHLDVTMRA